MNKPETKWSHIKADRDECSSQEQLHGCSVICCKETEQSSEGITAAMLHTNMFAPISAHRTPKCSARIMIKHVTRL